MSENVESDIFFSTSALMITSDLLLIILGFLRRDRWWICGRVCRTWRQVMPLMWCNEKHHWLQWECPVSARATMEWLDGLGKINWSFVLSSMEMERCANCFAEGVFFFHWSQKTWMVCEACRRSTCHDSWMRLMLQGDVKKIYRLDTRQLGVAGIKKWPRFGQRHNYFLFWRAEVKRMLHTHFHSSREEWRSYRDRLKARRDRMRRREGLVKRVDASDRIRRGGGPKTLPPPTAGF